MLLFKNCATWAQYRIKCYKEAQQHADKDGVCHCFHCICEGCNWRSFEPHARAPRAALCSPHRPMAFFNRARRVAHTARGLRRGSLPRARAAGQ